MPRKKTEICVECKQNEPQKGRVCEKCRYQKRKPYYAKKYRDNGGYDGWRKKYPHLKGPKRQIKNKGIESKRSFVKSGGKCNRCGYNDYPEILQIHHVDHNHDNNSKDNLELLCPNCHRIEHLVFTKADGNPERSPEMGTCRDLTADT